MNKVVQFIAGIILLITLELFKSKSGGDASNSLGNYLSENIFWFRIIGWLIIIFPALTFMTGRVLWTKMLTIALLIVYAAVFYLYNT